MECFETKKGKIAAHIVFSVFGATALALLLMMLLPPSWSALVGAAVAAFMIISVVNNDIRRFEVDENELRVFDRKKLICAYSRSECQFRTALHSGTAADTFTLTVSCADGRDRKVDCSMLDRDQFRMLMKALGMMLSAPELPNHGQVSGE